MKLRKSVIAVVAAAMLAGSMGQSKALPADPVATVVAGGTGFTGVAWVAAGVVGVAAGLCAYDLILKIQGVKNWDGSAKVFKKAKR